MWTLGVLLLMFAAISTWASQRPHKPVMALAIWVVYVASLVAGMTLLAGRADGVTASSSAPHIAGK